ncbi:MAG TPA: ATP-binding protein [Acidobacteriota bacterium]|nr:ATP-binding protein [Acidobacteriota bacterium]HNT18055.1 ATP-binding protein [Acidobacteriota bacterium]
MTSNCKRCGGTGYIVEDRSGSVYSKPCACIATEKDTLLHRDSMIPDRYRNNCVLENFTVPEKNASLQEAFLVAKKYAGDYPFFEEGKPNGLLFIGPCGVGKTHLAVSILNEILFKKKKPVRFVDLNDLYREIRASYDGSQVSEYDILTPLVETELLLVDELGCVASPWAQDTLLFLVSQRYNQSMPTILTTNYLDEPAPQEPSLTARIGVRSRSRLREMCRTVVMNGEDYRNRRHRQ